LRNSCQRAGSRPNHFRNAVLGAMSLIGYYRFLLPRSGQCFAGMKYDSRFAGVVVMLCD